MKFKAKLFEFYAEIQGFALSEGSNVTKNLKDM